MCPRLIPKTMCNYDPVRYGCFCDDCVARFNKKYGMSFSREELVRNINDITDIRKMYVEFVRGSIGDFAFFLSDAVHSASPDSTIGFQPAAALLITPYGAKWAVFGDGLWNRVISSERRSELLNIAEYINPWRLTAVLETHAKAIILPRENAEHKLVCVTVINATVGKSAELKLRVRNTAGARFSYMSQYNDSGTLTPHRNGEDITLTLPAIDAWSALTVFVG